MDKKAVDPYLKVYADRSVYHAGKVRSPELFLEGPLSNEAKTRAKQVRAAFENGFLDNLISELLEGEFSVDKEQISTEASVCVDELVTSLTSEVGRALIGLSVMQLCIKAITKEQNIRLHKGSASRKSFSWIEGISMRTLDKKYVTPTLRKYGLLRLNADGFMMTRSLAENYPYTPLYKAKIRGARTSWLTLVEEIERENTSALETLKMLIARLINAALEFQQEADRLVEKSQEVVSQYQTRSDTRSIVFEHIDKSDYAARLLEISMHALAQAAVTSGAFGDMEIKPLSQMRSANKKHGNVADIELMENGHIVEAWDAKYGKSYLRDELEEILEKLRKHDFIEIVGFVTSVPVEKVLEITSRINEIEQLYSVRVSVLTYQNWIDRIYQRVLDTNISSESELSQSWLMTYCKYIGQKRRDIAPIDEPCLEWVRSFRRILEKRA